MFGQCLVGPLFSVKVYTSRFVHMGPNRLPQWVVQLLRRAHNRSLFQLSVNTLLHYDCLFLVDLSN